MDRSVDRLPQRIYYLASGLFLGAVFLRSILIFQNTPVFTRVIVLLLVWLGLLLSEPAISRFRSRYFPYYLVIQTSLVLILLVTPGFSDFYAVLFHVLSMQVMARLDPKAGALWLASYALFMLLLFGINFGIFEAVALTLVYTAGNVFLGFYSLVIRRAEAAHQENQVLASELEAANLQLESYASQLAQLAVVRERNRLAREMHDSVTQTVFSMNLTAQSALLLMERNRGQVGTSLDRLNQLAKNALSEMQLLISELKPDKAAREDFVLALRKYLSGSHLTHDLSVSLEAKGDNMLAYEEQQALFHIAVEAINNVVKHALTSEAKIQLHLSEPCWMEISDHGRGFDLMQARDGESLGLSGMLERAEEIGWKLQIITAPGQGTCIRVKKCAAREEAV